MFALVVDGNNNNNNGDDVNDNINENNVNRNNNNNNTRGGNHCGNTHNDNTNNNKRNGNNRVRCTHLTKLLQTDCMDNISQMIGQHSRVFNGVGGWFQHRLQNKTNGIQLAIVHAPISLWPAMPKHSWINSSIDIH